MTPAHLLMTARELLVVLFALLLLAGCSPQAAAPASSSGLASAGQVEAAITPKMSFYAASRLAEQASFGPTPALIQEIQKKGAEAWIDEQFALPPTLADLGGTEDYANESGSLWYYQRAEIMRVFLSAPDQLRLRVLWGLSQVVVVTPVDVAATLHWFNLLQRRALGNYRDLLYDASVNPAMGIFLNNNQNRPKSDECKYCQPNENFARELMQLFTLGVVQLRPDGTAVRNAAGKLQTTYTQRDVEELARVLTGWQIDPLPLSRPRRNWGNWGRPMVPTTWPPERDAGEKTVLGRTFPAGQSAPKDLLDAVDLLVSHDNIGPFVAQRLIQHLVMSDPSADYVRRVAERFRNNGQGVRGDMKSVVKAVLMDPEARRGDDPSRAAESDGKLREPLLHRTAVYRGLGCNSILMVGAAGNIPVDPTLQRPFAAETVFGFYTPVDRSSITGLLAPEQRLITSDELVRRLEEFRLQVDYPSLEPTAYRRAGCERLDTMFTAFRKSKSEFTELLSRLYFRGAMSPVLRREIEDTLPSPKDSIDYKVMFHVLGLAVTSPQFGSMP